VAGKAQVERWRWTSSFPVGGQHALCFGLSGGPVVAGLRVTMTWLGTIGGKGKLS